MRATRRSGFTLIETVAAIVILAVAVPPMLWAVTESQRQRINPMMASRARWLAVEKLEDIIADRHSTGARGYAWVLGGGDYVVENPGDITGYPGFSRSVALLETKADLTTTAPPPLGYLTVTVTVGWIDAKGNAQTLDISTVLTDYTPT
jgi:prepilin-type N-terminal cleavage/methylation domain-containing protein